MTNRIWKLLGFLLIACLLLSGVSALAEPGTLKVTLGTDDVFKFNNGVTFELYKVGVPDGTTDSAWAPTDEFSSVTLLKEAAASEGSNEWSDAEVKAIIGQVKAVLKGKTPIRSDETNDSGVVEFTGLEPGIYYGQKKDESYPKRLKVFPFLIAVPALNTDKPYNVAANLVNSDTKPKYTYTPPELINFTTIKTWRDQDDFDGIRPSTIEVKLQRTYKGEPDEDFNSEQKNIKLTAENSWTYTWPGDQDEEGFELPDTDEDDNKYVYSAIEVSREYNYDDPIYENYGHIITNPHTPDYGCIEVTKKVTVGGKTIEGTTLVDGTYVFTLTGPTELAESRRNELNYFNAYRIDLPIIGGEAKSWSKTYVMPGTYVVEEIGMVVDGKVVDLPTTVEADNTKIEIKVTDRVERDNEGKPVLSDPSDLNSKPKLREGYDNGTITNNLNAGSLTVSKAVTLNGAATDDPRINGTYRFTVTGPTYVDPFEIEVKNGKSDSKVITDLVPGVYTVTESSDNLPVGVSIASGSGVTYTVNAGANTDAVITNNLGIGSLRIVKTVTVNGASTTSTRADGTYTFTVKGPSYPSGQKVTITIKNGASNSTQLDNLLVGEYTISEDTSSLPSGMSLRSTNDLRLNVTGGTVTDASFTNNIGTPTVTPPPNIVVNPTPTPLPNINITGQKIWNDENNLHNVRPTTITVQLLRNGSVIRETNVTGNMTAERWTYRFTGLPQMNAQGEDYVYTVRELPVTGYTTNIDGFTITNDLIPRTPNEYTNFNGTKTWDDSDNMEGLRPNYIIVRLMRDGEEVDRRTVTGANSWQYTFQNMPLDDGYGHTYEYTISEDPVTGYVGRIDGFDITNSRLPEDYGVPLAGFNEPEMEDLMELYDYETPQWGRPLKTGDEMPLYPIVFGGIGLTALVALAILIVIGKKREKNAA